MGKNHQKKIMVSVLAAGVALSICSCQSREEAEPHPDFMESEIIQDKEISEDQVREEPEQEEPVQMQEGQEQEGQEQEGQEQEGQEQEGQEQEGQEQEEAQIQEEQTESAISEENGAISFADLNQIQFCFSSGAGAWATVMTIHADGSFSGEYHDSDMGVTGDSYPNGTQYRCDFSGQFTQPVKVNDYTYSMQISELNFAKEAGTEEIRDGVRYIYSEANGLDGAQDILIYLPGAPLEELSEDFRSWIGYYDLSRTTDTELPFYALNNEAQQYGFSSYNIIDNLEDNIAFYEEWAASLKNSMENDSLSQAEYNEKAEELYEVWDAALNQTWNVLKQILDEEAMSALTAEELEWIALKEQAVAEAGAEYEGSSIRPMIMDLKAAEMTEERVYELMNLLE